MDTEPVQLFILAGQSNMSGRADASLLTPELNAPFDDVIINWLNDINWGDGDTSNGWTFLQPQYFPKLHKRHFGPEITLGRKLHAELKTPKIALVKMGLGSTNLHTNWNPEHTGEDAYYPRFVAHYQHARDELEKKGSKVVVAGLFWMQGESDANKATDANNYEANLKKLVATIRELVGVPELPVVLGKINWKRAKKQAVVNKAIENFAQTDKCACFVDTSDLSKLQDDHFDGEALQMLGTRMAEAFLRLTKQVK